MYSAYAPLLLEKDHQHLHLTVQVTILQPTTTTTTATTLTTTAQIAMHACIQYMRHCFRKKKQTTSASYCGLGPAPAPFRPPHVSRSTCAQWWKIRTTSASTEGENYTATIGMHNAASTCNLHKGHAIEFLSIRPIQLHMLLCKLTCACCIVHANGGGVVFILCTCAGGPYLPPLCTCTPWHMRWSEGCWCWTKPTVTCTGGLFFVLLGFTLIG